MMVLTCLAVQSQGQASAAESLLKRLAKLQQRTEHSPRHVVELLVGPGYDAQLTAQHAGQQLVDAC